MDTELVKKQLEEAFAKKMELPRLVIDANIILKILSDDNKKLEAELTAHKAKIDELKEWCKIEYKNADKNRDTDVSGAALGSYTTLKNILQKLEELDK